MKNIFFVGCTPSSWSCQFPRSKDCGLTKLPKLVPRAWRGDNHRKILPYEILYSCPIAKPSCLPSDLNFCQRLQKVRIRSDGALSSITMPDIRDMILYYGICPIYGAYNRILPWSVKEDYIQKPSMPDIRGILRYYWIYPIYWVYTGIFPWFVKKDLQTECARHTGRTSVRPNMPDIRGI